MSVSQAKSYLGELVLRREPLSNREALSAFGRHLRESEVRFDDSAEVFVIQLNDLGSSTGLKESCLSYSYRRGNRSEQTP